MLRLHIVEKWQIRILEAAEINQQNATLYLPCSSIVLLLLDVVGHRALCYMNWLSLHTFLKFVAC